MRKRDHFIFCIPLALTFPSSLKLHIFLRGFCLGGYFFEHFTDFFCTVLKWWTFLSFSSSRQFLILVSFIFSIDRPNMVRFFFSQWRGGTWIFITVRAKKEKIISREGYICHWFLCTPLPLTPKLFANDNSFTSTNWGNYKCTNLLIFSYSY